MAQRSRKGRQSSTGISANIIRKAIDYASKKERKWLRWLDLSPRSDRHLRIVIKLREFSGETSELDSSKEVSSQFRQFGNLCIQMAAAMDPQGAQEDDSK